MVGRRCLGASLVVTACSAFSLRHEGDDAGNASEPWFGGTGGASGRGGTLGDGGSDENGGSAGTGAGATGGRVSAGGKANRGGQGGTTGEAGDASAGSDGLDCYGYECWDGTTCWVALRYSGCPATYDDVLARSPSDFGGCAARTTAGAVYVLGERLCVYDADGELVSFRLDGNERVHCDGRAEDTTGYAALPARLDVTDFDYFRFCFFPPQFHEAGPSDLFVELFGDGPRVDSDCSLGRRDTCRSSLFLFVCRDFEDEDYCDVCRSDEECELEYPYLVPSQVSCEAGVCRIDARPLGTCGGELSAAACRTATDAFVCSEGTCARCVTDGDCIASLGNGFARCLPGGSCLSP